MRLSLPLALLVIVFAAAWTLSSAPSCAMDHAAHETAAADEGATPEPGAGHRPGCCSVEGGLHCAGPGSGLSSEPLFAGPAQTAVRAASRFEASALAARSPSPPAKPPRP